MKTKTTINGTKELEELSAREAEIMEFFDSYVIV